MACAPLVARAMPIGRLAAAEAPVQPIAEIHHHPSKHRVHRAAPRRAETAPPAEDTGDPAPAYGDTSGFPGGNEFDPTAPYGGQAAITARPGTDAYEEQSNQRRYFCQWAPNRC